MKFDLQKHSDKGFAMHCPTRESADIFSKFLHESGREWCDGESYINRNEYSYYAESTCYVFNKGTVSNLEYLSQNPNSYYILNFYDFDWEDDNSNITYESSESLECFLNDYTVVI